LKKFNTRTKVFSQYLYDKINPVASIHDIVLNMVSKSVSELWVGSADKGLGIFNIVTGRFTFVPHDASNTNSPMPGECYGLLKDRNGILWAGFYTGISRYIPQSGYFNHIPIKNAPGEYQNHITPTAFYKDSVTGMLYVGCTAGMGLYLVDEATGAQQVSRIVRSGSHSEFSSTDIYDIKPRGAHELLLATNSGIALFDKRTKQSRLCAITDQEGKPLNYAAKLVESNPGYWCNAGFDGGFYFVDSGLRFALHYYKGASAQLKLATNEASVLAEDNDTLVWVATRDKGLSALNPVTNMVRT
jgi:ligand-binding sensor domain-containing protein